nr:hypothetical protein GCM10020093_100670 [Planobispora longispora]
MQAFTTLEVEQVSRAGISAALGAIPEVLEAHIVTGPGDVWCRIAGRDHEHIQEVIDRALAIPGVRRSSTVITLSAVVPHRVHPWPTSADPPPPTKRPRRRPRAATSRGVVNAPVGVPWCRIPSAPWSTTMFFGITDIWAYAIGAFLIILLPGPNSLYVLATAARHGCGRDTSGRRGCSSATRS